MANRPNEPHTPNAGASLPSDDAPPPDLAFAEPGEPLGWLGTRRNRDLILYTVYLLSAIVFGLDYFLHKHSQFQIEHYFGFYALFGLASCAGLMAVAHALRVLLMRPEDYYDR